MNWNQSAGATTAVQGGLVAGPPAAERVTGVLSEACQHLQEALDVLTSAADALDGPVPRENNKGPEVVGVTGLAFEARRLAALVRERLSTLTARL